MGLNAAARQALGAGGIIGPVNYGQVHQYAMRMQLDQMRAAAQMQQQARLADFMRGVPRPVPQEPAGAMAKADAHIAKWANWDLDKSEEADVHSQG